MKLNNQDKWTTLNSLQIQNLLLEIDQDKIFNTAGQRSQLFFTSNKDNMKANIGQPDARDFSDASASQ